MDLFVLFLASEDRAFELFLGIKFFNIFLPDLENFGDYSQFVLMWHRFYLTTSITYMVFYLLGLLEFFWSCQRRKRNRLLIVCVLLLHFLLIYVQLLVFFMLFFLSFLFLSFLFLSFVFLSFVFLILFFGFFFFLDALIVFFCPSRSNFPFFLPLFHFFLPLSTF